MLSEYIESMIMTKYAEWDRYIERFGGITIKPQALKEILEAVDEDKLVEIAKRSGSRFPREFVLFWFKRANLDNYLKSLKLAFKYKDMPAMSLRLMGQNIL